MQLCRDNIAQCARTICLVTLPCFSRRFALEQAALFRVTLRCTKTRYSAAGIMQGEYMAARSKTVPPLIIAQPTWLEFGCIRTMTAISTVI